MTGLVRKATLLVVAGLMIAGAAMAGVPSPANSDVPTRIIVIDADEGSPAGVPRVGASICALPGVGMVIRDASNNPVSNVTVVLDFTACAPDADVEECSAQPDPVTGSAGVTTGPGETLTYTADGAGQLCAVVIGSGTNQLAAGARPVCGRIFAASVLMGTVTVSVAKMDLQGDADVDAFDGSLWLANVPYTSNADYDGDGDNDAFDGSLLLVGIGQPITATEISVCPGLLP